MRDHPYSPDLDHHALNALLNLQGADGGLQLDADQAAIAAYFRNHVDPLTVTFESVDAQIDWLVAEGYYEATLFAGHDRGFLRALWAQARARGFRFQSFLGAFKFHTGYALRTRDGRRYLEGYEDRVVIVALALARGDEALARRLVEEMLSGRFQPATPTFLNAGRVSRGELVSCFLLRLEDNMESIGRGLNSALQLSRRGGGVALMLSNLRETGAPIKGIANQSSGVVPVMKLLEDSFSYADQLGARQGAGAVYLHAHHPDILRFLDTRRENADEKIRIKTLSLGVVIPDVTFALAAQDAEMHLFSPHDVARVYGRPFSEVEIGAEYDAMVANPAIGKTTLRARRFFEILAEIQFESGYPYLVFEDTVNRANPIAGRVTMSNLCTEILQVAEASQLNEDLSYAHVGTDISCNLGSLNIARVMDGGDIGAAVETAVQALTAVSELSAINAVPSIRRGNDEGHAIGLGQMNLHGFLAREALHYGSPAAIDFTSAYFAAVAYHALAASMRLARARGRAFAGFERSSYASGAYFERYVSRDWHPETPAAQALFARFGITLPDRADWRRLRAEVMAHGIYNRYLQAVPPTGSISYINHATASIHPIAARIEIRKEGRIGRVYYPAPHMTAANLCYYRDAYEIGPEAIIDTYAAATVHVDQGLSLTLFFPDTATTRDLNRAQIRAWRAGIKTLYYVRLRQAALAGTAVEGCLSCAL